MGTMLFLLLLLLLPPHLYAHLLLRTDCRGDIFAYDDVSECGAQDAAATVIPWTSGNACQCAPPTTTFRLDTGACVDKLHECLQVPLDGKAAAEAEIPLVPTLFHDHPVRFNSHLAIHKVVHFENFACRVSHEKYLSAGGWLPLTNLTSSPLPFTFQLAEMKDREIALNFLGSEEESWRLEGRLIRVGLSCQSAEKANIVPQPCIAFRVGGASLQPEDDLLKAMEEDANGLNKWLIIALGAGLLGVTYVLAILVYVLIRKRSADDNNGDDVGFFTRFTSGVWRRCCCRRKRKKEEEPHRKRLCERCMTSSSVLKWVNSQSRLESGEKEAAEGDGMSNVTVVSINSPSMTNHQQQQKKINNRLLARSKSDIGLANGRKATLAAAAKRSESMLMAKCVSFDPHDVIIEGRKLVTFASLPSVRDDDEVVSECAYEAAGPASILKKSQAVVMAAPPPPRFLLTSFNRKQRRGGGGGPVGGEEKAAEVGKLVKLSVDDLGYHSGDSERVNESIDFTQAMDINAL